MSGPIFVTDEVAESNPSSNEDSHREWLNTVARLGAAAGAVAGFDEDLARVLADLATGVVRSLYPELREDGNDAAP